ncbi:MAG: glycosyltransferase family 2 protein [Rhodobacteraceae bacterium]|nr:glycosyltransferase family 2 protein [Paracoccaceae bacterium]
MFERLPSSSPSWSVVVPVRDEAGNIAPLADEIVAAMAAFGDFEVIFVDDGSRDTTAAEIEAVQNKFANFRIVRHRHSYGQSQALITGVENARAPWVVTLDGDGQNDPADIAALISALDAQQDRREQTLVIGRRNRRLDGQWRSLASIVARWARRIMLADVTADSGCGLKIISRKMFLDLPRFDALHRFIPSLVRRERGTVVSVSVKHRPRAHGRSKYGIAKRGLIGLVDLFGVWWLMRRYSRPDR